MKFFRKLGRRSMTADRDMNQTPIHVVEQIGEKRSLTPEGFLFCEDVPISRVGMMMYGPGEVPIQAGPDGIAWVSRTEDELFKPETIASFNGKPIVDEHPGAEHEGKVTPANMTKLVKGWTLNPRRGTGQDHDVLLADLLITDAGMIRDVDAGKREVSAGYEADYRQTGTGRGDQSAIIGNHVALVEKGRCGPRCAIGDHSPQEELFMPKQTVTISRRPVSTPPGRRTSAGAAVRQIFRDAEAEALSAMGLPGDDPGGDDDEGDDDSATHIHIHAGGGADPAPTTDDGTPPAAAGAAGGENGLEARVTALETGVAEILQILKAAAPAPAPAAPAATGDGGEEVPPKNDGENEGDDDVAKSSMTGDSVALETSFKDMVAAAEILLPGVALPSFDGKAKRATTIDSMCSFRRRVLDGVMLTTDGSTLLKGLSDGLDLAKATCSEIGVLFKAAAQARGQGNNRTATGDARMGIPAAPAPKPSTAPRTIAELNEFNRKHFANKQ